MVVVQAARLDCLVDRRPAQAFGHVARAAAARIADHVQRDDLPGVLVHGGAERGLAEVLRERRDQRVRPVRHALAQRVGVGGSERAERLGRHTCHPHPVQPFAQLAGQPDRQPGQIVDRGDDGLRAGHLCDLRDHLGGALDLRQRQDQIARRQAFRQVVFGIIQHGRQDFGRLPDCHLPAGWTVAADVIDVTPAIFSGHHTRTSRRMSCSRTSASPSPCRPGEVPEVRRNRAAFPSADRAARTAQASPDS